MTYTLYYSPGMASLAVHWMLIELDVPFDVRPVDLKAGAQRSADYLRMNPSGRVPTLVVDGVPHGESAALLMLLAERHPEAGLAPSPGSPARAEWLELMIYLANGLLPAMRNWFYAGIDGDPTGADAVKALARAQIEAVMERLDRRLGDGRAYLLGERPSTADFLALMLMRWSRSMPRPATTWPHLLPYIERLRARPAFIELNAREGLTEWLNPPA
ncbi:glutathione S-transferase family protein [Burkholderia alba]|uniref:glutathione S-transferase family protein n=1 Tax=Burkholderia alba TaxID=2683677 RepID=UPI002B05E6D5|nr:glutathione S-transferase family protein [Burkholderia alba]